MISQILKELEIIVIDDASTDHSLNIIEEYIMKYPEKIKVIQNEKIKCYLLTTNSRNIEELSSKVGFLELEKLKNMVIKEENFGNLEVQLTKN